MNKLTYSGASIALAALLTMAPALTFAQVNINSEATGSLEADVNLNATDSDATLEVGTDTEVNSATGTEKDTATNTETDTGLALRLNADGVAIISAIDVNTEADLEVFAHNVAVTNDLVSEMETEVTEEGKSRVIVTYTHQGELFGVMPITMESTTIVTTGDGEVEVESDLPWWSFVVTKKNHAAGEIESRIKDNPTVMMSAEMEATAAVQAEVIEAVVTELEAHSALHAALNG